VRGAHPRQRGRIVGAWTRGGRTKERGRTCPRASPNITRFLQGGASTSGQRQRHLKAKAKGKGKRLKA
jgi:hypothetical protein